ncbi:Calcium/calmodulin-dependent protein kinase-like [Venturia nashicola]|nr:Calcium/calmodulin-dependent protein kinase-like [Venturia nashicola]
MLSQQYKILETSEAFEEVDGVYKFAGTLVVVLADKNLYHGSMKAPSPIPPNCYTKRPRLISYDRLLSSDKPHQIADRVLKECEIYEILKHHPHPNIAEYLGYEGCNSLITGIYLKKISKHSWKGRTLKDPDKVLQGIEKGIRHLHRLNLVHNDLTPSNIMLFDDDTPVITDFDSCHMRVGCQYHLFVIVLPMTPTEFHELSHHDDTQLGAKILALLLTWETCDGRPLLNISNPFEGAFVAIGSCRNVHREAANANSWSEHHDCQLNDANSFHVPLSGDSGGRPKLPVARLNNVNEIMIDAIKGALPTSWTCRTCAQSRNPSSPPTCFRCHEDRDLHRDDQILSADNFASRSLLLHTVTVTISSRWW